MNYELYLADLLSAEMFGVGCKWLDLQMTAMCQDLSCTAAKTFTLPHRGEPRNEANATLLSTGTVISLEVDLTMLMA